VASMRNAAWISSGLSPRTMRPAATMRVRSEAAGSMPQRATAQPASTARRRAATSRSWLEAIRSCCGRFSAAKTATASAATSNADRANARDTLGSLDSLSVPAVGQILVQPDDLSHRVKQLAEEISRDYDGRELLLVGVLKGAVFFLSDLMRHLEVPCEVDFMAVSSYGSSTESSGVVRIMKDLDTPIEGRDVLVVEDIVDSGLTLKYLLRTLSARNPSSLEVCALLEKPERRKVDLEIRYTGFEIPNCFVIGYGLDNEERFRNLPYVAVLNQNGPAAE